MSASGAALRRLALLGAAALAACGGEPPAPRPAPPGPAAARAAPPRAPQPSEGLLGPYPRSQFYIERDLFLAADEPRVVPADQAGFLRPADEVLGLVIQGRARAYAVTMLSYHHVVNDVVQGIPVAVTY